jgi:hypothetical protein
VKKRTSSKPKASGDQFAQIIELHKQGLSNKYIADHLGINGQSVNGVLQNARRNGVLPPFNLSMRAQNTEPTPQPGTPVSLPVLEQVTPPMNNGNHQMPAPQPSSSPQDDFSGGRPVVGASGGFTGANQAVKYTVERIAPPDGHLGTHYGSFSVEELGQNYGEGTYKVTKHDPLQKWPTEHIQKIGSSYGEARSPNHTSQRPPTHGRPFFQRPWMGQPQGAPQGEEPERPIFRPSYQRPPDNSQAVLEIARQQAGNTSAMETALNMVQTMHQQSLASIDAARKTGPDTMVTQFLREQQEITNRRWEEDRAREADKRREEDEKWRRQQEEAQRRWERDQQAERDRHQRELERITREAEAREKQMRLEVEEREKRAAEERRFLLDLEEKKLQLVRQESEATQRRLEAELTRLREETKERAEAANRIVAENQEATRQHIEESQKQIQEQLDREREQLEREHKLKEKALDKQHELEGKMIDLQKESIQNSGGDHIFNTINTVIKEVSKGLEKVVDYKKLEIMTPEAQIAHVAKGSAPAGASQEAPAAAANQAQQPPPQVPPQAAAQEQYPQPQAAAQPAAQQPASKPGPVEAMVENRMETLIRENLRKPFFQEVLKEWALHVESSVEDGAVDATTFANLYLEMMRDPRNDEGRQGCAAFATFMKPRSWKKMLAVLAEAIDAETLATFQKPEAEEFYKQFKAMVLEQITEYWEQFLAARQQRGAAAQPNAQPAAAAPVEQAPASQAQNAAPNGQTP